MAKITIISPKLILEKTWEWLGKKNTNSKNTASLDPPPAVETDSQQPSENSSTFHTEEVASHSPIENPPLNSSATSAEQKKFAISLQEMKTISAALVHFQKYLAKKGELSQAQAVEAIDRKIDDFIRHIEKNGGL